ncbi:hypothetical protein SDC9_94136 [bioreactor metagenome]|uniref:Uncharacterized protein n=1 Tax=bioreactor metagenome TaxID=1076179 RepID=A0A645A3B3_9ZZZZ
MHCNVAARIDAVYIDFIGSVCNSHRIDARSRFGGCKGCAAAFQRDTCHIGRRAVKLCAHRHRIGRHREGDGCRLTDRDAVRRVSRGVGHRFQGQALHCKLCNAVRARHCACGVDC